MGDLSNHIAGAILGTAVGDALGLPYEGLSPRRAARLLGEPTRHRFCFGRGMVSDDTEHTCAAAQSLIEAPNRSDEFANRLARRLRWWLAGVPAGCGLATAVSLIRSWLGWPPDRSGVYSAGNGPCMRVAVLGAAIDDLDHLQELVKASTVITHTDPLAECGAQVIALAAWFGRRSEPDVSQFEAFLFERLARLQGANKMMAVIEPAMSSAAAGQDTVGFASSQGLTKGVSGYVLHTVPVALHAWLRHPGDYRAAVTAVIRCGGDADTMAAIVGGICGASLGVEAIPPDWLAGVRDWPRTVTWMMRLAEQLADALIKREPSVRPPRLSPLVILPRNLLFLATVLFHGLRRCFPPY